MTATTTQDVVDDLLIRNLHETIYPLTDAAEDDKSLLDHIGEARFILLGEASYETHEFYRERTQITKRLIREKGFAAVAVEADWPHADRVNRCVRGNGNDPRASDALVGFRRFPAWMWRNTEGLNFVGWLRTYNEEHGRDQSPVSFYGLGLYSLHASIEALLAYVDKAAPEQAERARTRDACFDLYGDDTQAYGFASGHGLEPSCELEVVIQLVDLRNAAAKYVLHDGEIAEDESFYADQNARLVRDAEQYYRTIYRGGVSSWNLRDRHMAESFDSLVEYIGQRGERPKVEVWDHNSCEGDAVGKPR